MKVFVCIQMSVKVYKNFHVLKLIANTVLEGFCWLSCSGYWYLCLHIQYLVIKLWIDFHSFRLCAILNDKSVEDFVRFIANFNVSLFL